jgi:adenylate cyclase
MSAPPVPAPSGAIAAALKSLWGNRRRRATALFLLTLVLSLFGQIIPQPDQSIFDSLDREAFDAQMRALRDFAPTSLQDEVILIGLNDGSITAFPEPIALWHGHLGKALSALAKAKPKAVGVDIILPERSFDALVPGLDLAMFRGIRDLLKQNVPLVFARGVDSDGHELPVHNTYQRLLGETRIGIDQQLVDHNQVARRFSERELGGFPTLVGQMLRSLGKPVGEGYIDYSIGAPIDYVPMQQVTAWLDSGDEAELKRHFSGRIVLIGSVWTHMDRWVLPVKVIGWEKDEGPLGLRQPGVIVHMQALRSQLATGLITPLPAPIKWLLCVAAAAIVFLRSRLILALAGGVALPAALTILSLVLLRTQQTLFPLITLVLTLWIGLIVRGIVDAIEGIAERSRLKRDFSGSVSPAVLDEIMAGRLASDSSARLVEVCVIFSDIRGFTALSESMPPEMIMKVLQRYFDSMVKVVHRFDGTIDKFLGDGMMILFGAPRVLADPCSDAVRCALAMLHELDSVNAEFTREGLPTLVIGIGINYGNVVVGNIGSTERHNYSAIGDAVNVAARIEGLTKELGRKIVITESVVSRLGDRFNFEPLGERLVRGHSPVKVWGIRMARATSGSAVVSEGATMNGG